MVEAGFSDKICFAFGIQVALDLQTTPQNADTLPHAYSCSGHDFCPWFVLYAGLETTVVDIQISHASLETATSVREAVQAANSNNHLRHLI